MPTYHFRCPKGHDTDRFFKTISGAPAEIECPQCGERAARQLSGGAGLLFKGSGFYLTDYGKNAHRKAAPEKKDSAASSATKSEGSGKSESRHETKSETGKPKADGVKPKPKPE